MTPRPLPVLALLALAGAAQAQPFIPGNLVVSRVGDGSAALSGSATATFLQEFSTGGALVATLPMPTAAAGSNRAFALSGSATSEGMLTLSTDGRFLTIGGYDAAPGTASIAGTTSAAVNRIVGRIDSNYGVDTSTALSDAYSGSNIRSVASTDGQNFWLAGTSGTSGSVRYALFGGASSTQLSTTITNTRVANIFGGQLYTSAASGAFQGVSTVGVGLPTTSGQTIALLAGFPTTAGPSSYDYVFTDANTLYVADDRAVAGGGGLQKWLFSAGSWSLAYTINANLTAGLRGLTASVDPTGAATFYATTADAISASAGNKLVAVTDSGPASAFSTIAVAPGNTAFRGVDFAPVPTPGTAALLSLGLVAFTRRRRG